MFLENGVLPEMDIVCFLEMESYRKWVLYEMDIVCFLKMESY